MSDQIDILFFGDQTVDTHAFLKSVLTRGKSNPLINSFIVQASAVLREEVAQLSSLDRQSIPNFSTVQELSDRHHEEQLVSTAIESALLCISQLAHYLGFAGDNDSKDLNPSKTVIVGLCTGSLAAAAVASSPSAATLTPLALEAVRIAFRTGLHVGVSARRVYQVVDNQVCWSFLVPEISELEANEAIDVFHKERAWKQAIPVSRRAYVSAVGSNVITVSGPPSTLHHLFEATNTFRGTRRIQIPVHGPYHAPHLHGDASLQKILGTHNGCESHIIDHFHPKIPLLSTTSGERFAATSTRQLLERVLNEALNETLRFDRVLDGCVASVRGSDATTCRIVPLGPVNSIHGVVSILKKGTEASIVLENNSSFMSAKLPYNTRAPGNLAESKLAIVGMAGRFPGAADHEKFWQLLEQGLDVHREVPKERFDPKTHFDPTGKKRNTTHTPYGCFIDEPGLFDPRFFNMSPREAVQTDPMQRLSLVTAYEALEMAGYVPNRTPSTKLDRVGTFYGQTSDDWREINAAQDIDTYFITGGVRAFGPGRINYHFKFSGPSFSVDTACSSGMAAIQLACTSLWSGNCDTAIAGGVSVMTNSDIFSGLSRGQFLSKVGPCQTFDNEADGYCRADGIGTVIIKRLQDAEADKDNVLAVILGSATNHSAEAISITHPHAETQESLYKKILDEAGVDALDVDYVEMHGTGTQAGDGTEMRSVSNVFAPVSRKRRSDQSLHLGAVKANVGHGEAASGVTALIKCLLMMQKNAIPPHVGIKNIINQTFPKDLDERNVHIALKKKPWQAKAGKKRVVFVNNFSAAGGNTALLMEDGPSPTPGKPDPRPTHIIAVSAKAKSSLRKNLERLISYIDDNPSASLPDISYTLTARRIQHNYRVAFPATDVAQARAELVSKLNDNTNPVSSTLPKVAFVFTGQGSHYPALGKDLFEHSSQFKSDLLDFDSIGRGQGFPSFLPLIDGSVSDVQSLSPLIVQLGLTCVQMALSRLWKSWGVTPDIVMGHSLGEYAALNVAGVLSVSDTIFLVGERARCLQDRCSVGTHAMLAVKAPLSSFHGLPSGLDGKIQVACINGPQETVYSGLSEDINKAVDHFSSESVKCTKLNVPFAFHSSQVDPILTSFEEIAQSAVFNKAEIPIISPLLGDIISAGDTISPDYLRRHAREPVNFLGGFQSGQTKKLIDDATLWVEIGPHPICLGMVKSTVGLRTGGAPSLRRGESAWKTVASSLCQLHTGGLKIDWNEYQRDFTDSLRMLDLPKYAFDEKNYWIQYVNDWCLTKGDLPNPAVLAIEEKKSLSTTSVHNVIHEEVKDGKVTVVIESDLSRPDLHAAVTGHLVNGSGLCPSSLYGDMAMTVADYMYKLVRPKAQKIDLNVCNMAVTAPLIAKKSGQEAQIVRLSATTNTSLDQAELVFSSGEGKSRTEHAKCTVVYGDGSAWLAEWQRNAYLIRARVEGLKKSVDAGGAHRIFRGMAYKLFAALVQYDKKYRGMEEVILDSMELEATARVAFQTTEADGNFFCSPYWIDSVAHLSGFIVNATDAVDSANQVYISHGWESLRFAQPLSADKTYQSYVKMQPAEGKTMAGDVYVFDGDTIIGVVGGLKFQCIPRAVFNTFIPPPGVPQSAKARKIAPEPPLQVKIPGTIETPKSTVVVSQDTAKLVVSVTSRALTIIAEEVGISPDELADPIDFADLGVDSLMSLSISGRMREELELTVQSSLFIDYPSVGQLKGFLAQFDTEISMGEIESQDVGSGSTTPDLESATRTPKQEEDGPPTPPSSTATPDVGVLVEEVASAPKLAALGIDQSMSASLHEGMQEKTGRAVPLLIPDNLNVQYLEEALNPTGQAHKVSAPHRSATSVLLQGNPRKSSKTLFLMPDGGGSATSYIGIPDLSPEVAVFGLNSPFMKCPEEYDCGVVGIAAMFLIELRRRQPHGPYLLGGWSAGGVVAFEAAQQLLQAGEVVEKLILIDTPCPLIIEALPSSLHRFFNTIGLLGDGLRSERKIPAWLLPHFAASVTALSQYTATKMDPARAPKTTAIWCRDGVCKYPSDPRPDPYPYGHAQWLLENRIDFGPQQWDAFIPVEKITTTSMSGNHFTMMREPNVHHLGDLIASAILN